MDIVGLQIMLLVIILRELYTSTYRGITDIPLSRSFIRGIYTGAFEATIFMVSWRSWCKSPFRGCFSHRCNVSIIFDNTRYLRFKKSRGIKKSCFHSQFERFPVAILILVNIFAITIHRHIAIVDILHRSQIPKSHGNCSLMADGTKITTAQAFVIVGFCCMSIILGFVPQDEVQSTTLSVP